MPRQAVHGEGLLRIDSRSVRAACDWPADEVPAEITEDVILLRLLALNGERAGSS